MDSSISNLELAILGLIAEAPKHGYQIEQDIAARGMRDWTEIGFSSIYYTLNRLETSGWLASERRMETDPVKADAAPRRAGRGMARRVYDLTETGRGVLREAVRERLAHPRFRTGDFDLALANLPALTADEAQSALTVYRDDLQERLVGVRGKWTQARAGAGFIMPHVDALFSHSLALIEAELAWVETYLTNQSNPASHIEPASNIEPAPHIEAASHIHPSDPS